jgi:hypothetical protein
MRDHVRINVGQELGTRENIILEAAPSSHSTDGPHFEMAIQGNPLSQAATCGQKEMQ